MSMIIHFQRADISAPLPWPVAVGDDGVVTMGLGKDDGASLMGFGPLGEQRVTVWPLAVSEDPSCVVGLVPSFAGKDGGMFEWACPVAEILIYQRKPEVTNG